MSNFNSIYFRRANKVVCNNYDENSTFNFAEVASFDANLRKLGYAFDGALAERLLHAPVDEIKRIHDTIIKEAKEIKGVRRYSPMYPNFPKQVMEADEAELWINAIVHYFGTSVGLRILPKYEKLARPELDFDEDKVTLVGLGSFDDFNKLMKSLVSSKSAFSPTDKADLESLSVVPELVGYVYNDGNVDLPNRENKAWLAARLIRGNAGWDFIKFDTATDVLRLAVALSDGDVSLSENTRFRSFSRPERRLLLGLLANIKHPEEDMLRYASAWKRLGERLHPGEHGHAGLFKIVRENGSVEGFNSRVEKALADENYLDAAVILHDRPGEFARRLDNLLRKADVIEESKILDIFGNCAYKASPTVLIQARNNFVNRASRNVRAFFPKGSVAKMQTVVDNREGIRKSTLLRAVGIFDNALYQNFLDRPNLGGSWVDPALKGIAVPFGMRNASKAVKTLGRGSRISLGEDTNVVRFFIWWKDAPNSSGWGYGSHTDIDLSAVIFDDAYKCIDNITFYNLRATGAVHSGDITSAPNGASEFIDIDIPKLRKRGARYVAMTLHSYSGQGFVELPECFAGFMERRDLDSGEIYDPRTVADKADLTANSRGATPFIFDLETGEAVWVDLSMQISGMAGTVASSKGQITSLVEAMTSLTPPNLYDLFSAHATARGGIVAKEKAKTVFSFDGDVTPFDTEVILDEYL
jgi:stress response protein SCP2